MEYTECPNCGNTDSGYKIFECKACDECYCFDAFLMFASGCGYTGDSKCPCCGADEGWRVVGKIVNNEEED